MMVDNLGHELHGGRESDGTFVAGDGIEVGHSDASLQFEALAQSGDSVDVGIEDFVLLIGRQGTLGRDRGSGCRSKHLARALNEKPAAEGILTAAVTMVGDIQTEHELLAFSSRATISGTSGKGRGIQGGHDSASANFPLFFHPLYVRRND